ncbi:hypothetical protein Pyn_04421 [Prunus yedoensis var. nudiflora]|uniref:Uncharacterized protein n=1 Tax=Prunus yedoensis var. nudiflora TaxID=2094558 RepID=A0A314Y934_PRUYE|nr:hypothetical protein Pyn_04421 [Prunus yedoensis var. nudiflora]
MRHPEHSDDVARTLTLGVTTIFGDVLLGLNLGIWKGYVGNRHVTPVCIVGGTVDVFQVRLKYSPAM